MNPNKVWLVYDGECPICRPTANALKIRAAVGELILVNARNPHPIMLELKQAHLNIDDGMVVKINNTLYHGADAQHILAMIGTNQDWFNRTNVWLFRSKFRAKLLYPIMRNLRFLVLKLKGISKINNLGNP
jgi:predicted DCC family thiol-disulfide oxidoreductase YuxK